MIMGIYAKELITCFGIFEVGLIIAVILSYPGMVSAYILAYNMGFLLFGIVKRRQINWDWTYKLGSIGFTFFLCADIPMGIISKIVNFSESVSLSVAEALIRFVASSVIAWIISRYVEKPLLNVEKK